MMTYHLASAADVAEIPCVPLQQADYLGVGGHIVGMTLQGAELEVALDSKKGIDVELPREAADFNRPWSTGGGSQKGY